MTDMEPVQILTEALAVLDSRGWAQGSMFLRDEFTGPVCMVGALRLACSEEGSAWIPALVPHEFNQARHALVPHVGGRVPEFWNDDPARTLDEVREAITKAIASYQTLD